MTDTELKGKRVTMHLVLLGKEIFFSKRLFKFFKTLLRGYLQKGTIRLSV